MLKIKLLARGKALTPYIGSVHTNGRVQKAFRAQIGQHAGSCVRGKVHKGMSVTDIRQAVADCAPAKGSVKLNLGRA